MRYPLKPSVHFYHVMSGKLQGLSFLSLTWCVILRWDIIVFALDTSLIYMICWNISEVGWEFRRKKLLKVKRWLRRPLPPRVLPPRRWWILSLRRGLGTLVLVRISNTREILPDSWNGPSKFNLFILKGPFFSLLISYKILILYCKSIKIHYKLCSF